MTTFLQKLLILTEIVEVFFWKRGQISWFLVHSVYHRRPWRIRWCSNIREMEQ